MEKNDKYNEKLSLVIIEKKIDFFKDVLQKTILHVKKVKNLDVLGAFLYISPQIFLIR